MRQICDRNGALEIAIAQSYDDQKRNSQDLVWRVRILGLTDSEIIVEQPTALGQHIPIEQGLELVGILSVGQNRWMFFTTNLGSKAVQVNEQKSINAIRLLMPEGVQRCQRRNYYRVSTAALHLPAVELWPLIDPASVVVAERANELQFNGSDLPPQERMSPKRVSSEDGMLSMHDSPSPFDGEEIMPDVGPKFSATLLNIGGGGIGLLIEPQDANVLNSHKLFWVRISLPPHLTEPVCATGKLIHSHMESTHKVYAGLAFDFSFNPCHHRFVVDQICRYIAEQQREQLQHVRKPQVGVARQG